TDGQVNHTALGGKFFELLYDLTYGILEELVLTLPNGIQGLFISPLCSLTPCCTYTSAPLSNHGRAQ
ncbi:MAG: hypothetical protein ACI94D_002355, partial [Neolewinella sp.]